MDKRKNNGGHSTKGRAGRKPKADEIKLAERMDKFMSEDEIVKKLANLVRDGNMKAVDLWMGYRYGKPNQSVDHTTNGNNITLPPLNFIDEED